MSTATYLHHIRHFHFRQMVAAMDESICRAGFGPLRLTWRDARELWIGATCAALRDCGSRKL